MLREAADEQTAPTSLRTTPSSLGSGDPQQRLRVSAPRSRQARGGSITFVGWLSNTEGDAYKHQQPSHSGQRAGQKGSLVLTKHPAPSEGEV